ncbi:hypothetical protein ACQUY5_18630 [Bacillus cereus]|uniref:hypothetical protein n=1 Tax=Bacillus cereus TaxID=1396 RepID=UPI003D1727DC
MTNKEVIVNALVRCQNAIVKLRSLGELRMEAVEVDSSNINIEYMIKKHNETVRVQDMYQRNIEKEYASYQAILKLAEELGFSEIELKRLSNQKVEELIKEGK